MKVLEWVWVEEPDAEREEEQFTGLLVRFRNDDGVLMTAQAPIHHELAEDMRANEDMRQMLLGMAVETCEWVMEENRHSVPDA